VVSDFGVKGRLSSTPFLVRPEEDLELFAAYLPTLNGHSAEGWMDIVCLACVAVLSTPLDRRGYWKAIPQWEIAQREYVVSMYQQWRRWFASKHVGRIGDVAVDWEEDVFTVSSHVARFFRTNTYIQPMLLHLAQVLIQYHEEEMADTANDASTALVEFGAELVKNKVVKALERYSAGLGDKLDDAPEHSRFWLYSGEEISIQPLPYRS
jgi:hypothetical protein